MVCLGNICRSPLAEGILQHKINQMNLNASVDSAGTSNFHVGESPDIRSIEKAKEYHFDISQQKGRQFTSSDFENFDLIYVMDKSNLSNVLALANTNSDKAKVKLIMSEIESPEQLEVPDPYYGQSDAFEKVYQMLNKATEIIKKKYLI